MAILEIMRDRLFKRFSSASCLGLNSPKRLDRWA